MTDFSQLEGRLLYRFENTSLLEEAVTHSSFANEQKNPASQNIPVTQCNYERLEFLGDAVLELIITDLLLEKYPDKNEGDMSKARSSLVREELLVKISRKIELGDFLKLGKGEKRAGGGGRDSILACALEAVIGAVYKDRGYKSAYSFVNYFWADYMDKVFTDELDIDYKTRLQELVQAKYKEVPEYEVVKVAGPAHKRTFKVRVRAADSIDTTGTGTSKKEAEQVAAHKAFRSMIGEEAAL
jgi:ribonuclease-3